jgi:hypothetical protein
MSLPWQNEDMTHATASIPPSGRARWFRRRGTYSVVDLRLLAPVPERLPSDPELVIARLTRLRDTGLITNAEFEAERRSLQQKPARPRSS